MANVTPSNARYLALTTYRRDGRPVTTPVWAAPLDGKLYVVTATSTGKARRVRATGRVRFAASNMSGSRIRSEWQEVREASSRTSGAETTLSRPYNASMAGSCPWRCCSTGFAGSIAPRRPRIDPP